MQGSRVVKGRRRLLVWSVLLLGLVLLIGVGAAYHWDRQVLLQWQEYRTPTEVREQSIWLADYQLVAEVDLDMLVEDAEISGLSWDPDRNTLFLSIAQRQEVLELALDGQLLRRIRLTGFNDPEGIEALGQGRMAIVDERKHLVALFRLDDQQQEIRFEDTARFDLGFADAGNKGFEGAGWDARAQQLILVKERDPMGVFSLAIPSGELPSGELAELPVRLDTLRDLSSVGVDPRTGHFLLLSDESRLVLEVDRQGVPVSFVSLLVGLHGLDHTIRQAEGVTMDGEGTLYVAGEPHALYIFRKP